MLMRIYAACIYKYNVYYNNFKMINIWPQFSCTSISCIFKIESSAKNIKQWANKQGWYHCVVDQQMTTMAKTRIQLVVSL